MSDRFQEELFVVTDTQDKLNELYAITTKEAGFFKSEPKVYTVTGSQTGIVWYYAIERKPISIWLDDDLLRMCYRPMMKKGAALLGTEGALILCYSDIESCKTEHLASNPTGRMKHYETSVAFDYVGDDAFDFAKENLPYGYEKFEKAFIKAYGEPGKEVIQIYNGLKE